MVAEGVVLYARVLNLVITLCYDAGTGNSGYRGRRAALHNDYYDDHYYGYDYDYYYDDDDYYYCYAHYDDYYYYDYDYY